MVNLKGMDRQDDIIAEHEPDLHAERDFKDATSAEHWKNVAELEPFARSQADHDFLRSIEPIIQDAEDTRIKIMTRHRNRGFAAITLGLMSIIAGAAGFGWFLLMHADLVRAVACMALAIVLPILLHGWSGRAVNAYIIYYKTVFMPQIAKALGGLKFHPLRGIGADILRKSGVLPPFNVYEAEDCFMGRYKGVKVIFCEADLYKSRGELPLFSGVLALIEAPQDRFKGHTVITADKALVRACAKTRWSRLQPFKVPLSNESWDRFDLFASDPAHAQQIVSEKLLKELAEAADVFNGAALSAALFRRRYVFLAIPYEQDMFEPSSIYVPVTSKAQALVCRRELERILEIIDVFELYGND